MRLRRLAARAAAVSVLIAGTALAGSGAAPAALAGSGLLRAAADAGSSDPTFTQAVTPTQAVAADLNSFTVSGTLSSEDGDDTITLNSVTATFDGAAVTDPITVTPGTDGALSTFQGLVKIPSGTSGTTAACGPNPVVLTLSITVTGDGTETQSASADPMTITAFCPKLAVSPAEVVPQDLPASYTVTPSGFPPADGPLTLTVDGTKTTFTTDKSGDLHFTASPPCGASTATVSEQFQEDPPPPPPPASPPPTSPGIQAESARPLAGDATVDPALDPGDPTAAPSAADPDGTATQTASFEVFCPSITVSPPAVSKQSLPAAWTVTPTDFPPSESAFSLSVNGTPTASTTDEGGDVHFTASPPCGPNTAELTRPFGDNDTAQASATFQVVCPSITISPPAVGRQSLPATWAVTPSGFLATGGAFTLTVGGTPTTFSTDDSGNLDFTASPPCGTSTATLTQDLGDGQTAVASAKIQVVCPSITISPPVVGKQSLPAAWTVTPTGYLATGAFTLTVDTTTATFTTDAKGNVDFTASPACGTHTATLTQDLGDGQTAVASATIQVLCPSITLNPASFPLAKQPKTVRVTGTQFHAGTPVTITVDGRPAGTATTDGNGGFQVPVKAGLDCGKHQVTATEQPTSPSVLFGGSAPALTVLFSESATLTVTNCTLTLALPPAVVEGEAAPVTGTGFAPGVPVTLTWQLPGQGGALPGTLTVTPSADGTIDGHFLIIPSGRLGPRQALAAQGKLKLTAGTVVMLSPAQPAQGGGQLVFRG